MDRIIEVDCPQAALYVSGERFSEGMWFSAETQIVFLLAAYAKEAIVDLVVVSMEAEKPGSGLRIPNECFKRICFLRKEQMPPSVQVCQLPAVLTADKVNVYSGLCTVLRYLVKNAACNLPQSKDLLSLLGHRHYCLKSCSEVSPRTKLCEVQMPSIVNVGNNHSFSSGSEIPEPIAMFESLLSEPITIHNMDKRQRVLLKGLEGNTATIPTVNARKRKKVVWTKDLPKLEHAFAEGVDFTLTDLSIFPCVHCFLSCNAESLPLLSKVIPKTMKWYCRLSSIKRLEASLLLCGVNSAKLPELVLNSGMNESTLSGKTEVLELDQCQSPCKITRQKETEMTVRRDLPTLLEKLRKEGIQVEFEEYRRENIKMDWSNLPKGTHPVEGELGTLRAERKCQQIENLAQAVKDLAKPGEVIVDFCSGGGHVGIVLAYLLPQCKILFVENKEESLDRARARVNCLGLKNVTIYQCNLEYFRGSFQVGVALHACGVTSDMVLQSCIAKNASFVISPCCYGKVRNCDWISYPQSKLYRRIPVSFDESLLLGHAADKTSWNFEDRHAVEGKNCMGLVDFDRAHAAVERGYKVSLYTMQPSTCTPKNNMLVGISPDQHKQ